MTYEKIKEIVTNNPNITAEEFGKELKKEKIDKEIIDQNGWTLLYYAVRSEGPSITGDRSIFLKVVELFTNLNIGIDFKDTASRTVLGMAAVNKQADVVKILLDSDKFDETEKFNALHLAIVQGNVQEFEVFLDYIDHAEILNILNTAPHNESTEVMKILLNSKRFTEQQKAHALSDAVMDGNVLKVKLLLDHMTSIPEDSIRYLLEIKKESKLSLEKELKIDSEFKGNPNNPDHRKYFLNLAIIKLLESAINGDNRNHDNEIPVVTETNQTTTPNSDNVNGQSNHNNKNKTPVIPEETNTKQTATPNNDNKANGFVDAQFSMPNEQETKYKESKKGFYISLTKDVVGVVITGLFIAVAVMVPPVAGAIVCGIIAALVAIVTGWHIKSSTLPSYREMEENKVEHVSPKTAQTL